MNINNIDDLKIIQFTIIMSGLHTGLLYDHHDQAIDAISELTDDVNDCQIMEVTA